MKEYLGNILRSFTAALADAALSCLLIVLMLTLYSRERTVIIALGVWAAALLIQSLLNELLARRSPSLLVYILFNAAAALAARHYVLADTVFIPGSRGFPILLGILIVVCGIHNACAAHKLPGSDYFVRMTDTLVIATCLYLAAAFGMRKAFHLPVLSFVLLALMLLIFVTAGLRAGGESDSVIRGTGIGGWLVLGALFVFCLLFTAALLGLGSGHVSSLVDVIRIVWNTLCAVLTALMKGFAYVLAFFIRPVSMRREYTVSESSAALTAEEIIEAAPMPQWISYVFLAVLVLLVLLVIAVIVWALHNARFTRIRISRRRRRVTRKSHMGSALAALFQKAFDRITFEIAYLLGRRTPQGLLVLAQRTGALHKLPRKKSESGGAYLRRLHGVLLAQGNASTLDTLAAQLDQLLYAGRECALTGEEYASYVSQLRQIRTAHSDSQKAQKQTHNPSEDRD